MEAALTVEAALHHRGLKLPEPIRLPPGVTLGFPWVRIHGDRAFISGHGPLAADGSFLPPSGLVGREVSEEQAVAAAEAAALAMLASLKRSLGDLDHVDCWLRVFGMVAADPSFTRYPAVINGFSDLIVSLYGEERGAHARSAVAVAGLPFGIPVEVEVEAEVAIRG